MRLALSAILALGIHAALFWVDLPWSRPTLIVPLSRAVSIDLVTIEKPIEKPVMPKPRVIQPKPKPIKPKPKPAPAPVVKKVAQPRPNLPAVPTPTEPPPEEYDMAEFFTPDQDPPAVAPATEPETADPAVDQAAVQASVPLYDLNPPPRYPRAARKRNYQGTVTLDVRVTVDGSVAQIRITKSSGYAILDRSAAKSVRGWRFSPALRAGQPIEMWVQVPVRFELH